MIVKIILSFVGGSLLVLSPLLCLRALNEDEEGLSRILVVFISLGGILGLIVAFLLASLAWWAALVGLIITIVVFYQYRRLHAADFTVDGPLLGQSAAPELAAQLAVLESEESWQEDHQLEKSD